MNMRNLIANGAIISMSAALLWHFSNIWRYGQYLVGEPNVVVRSLETAGLLLILGFGVTKYISDLRSDLMRKGSRQQVKPEDCPKLDECYKIKMILDKDLLDLQYAEAIRAVCANCREVKGGSGDGED